MANYEGTARTNYVHVENVDGLRSALGVLAIEIVEGSRENAGKVALLSQDDGGWPSYWDEDAEEERWFDPVTMVMPHVKEGEVLILMQSGHEKLRYLTGTAAACIRRGTEVRSIQLSLEDIYERAAADFDVPVSAISQAEH